MSGLIVRKEDGSLLFDTNLITHGLVKSGYLQPDEIWYRYYLNGINVDPNLRSSWTQGTSGGDQMFSITVQNAVNPICFIVGKGTLQGTARSGNTVKFYYAAASTNTKIYVFDLMNDTAPGNPPWLKARRSDGSISFNSMQVPLNIAYAIGAPAPSELDRFGHRQPYDGCRWDFIRADGTNSSMVWDAVADIPLEANVEFAAFINFTRGCSGWFTENALRLIGMSEGAYGRVGGISYMFSMAGETTDQRANTNTIPGCSVAGLGTDLYPTALVVRTANLPFPYN